MAKILVVDDSSSLRQMVAFTLRGVGHDVIEACDGAQALSFAETEPFDLVVSDLNMPVMDGVELTRSLRSKSDFEYTPIIMLTTETSTDLRREAKDAGATGWLVKPFNPDKLMATVQRVLD